VTLNKAANRLFVSQPFVPSVSELTYPKGMASQTYTDELSAAFGVAASPGNLTPSRSPKTKQ
jgi:hypothetical protein